MPQARQFTIGAGMLAVAAAGITCAAFSTLTTAWEPSSYYVGRLLPEMGSWSCFAIALTAVVLGPFLLVGLGLALFPINTDELGRGKKPANSDLDQI